MFSGNMMDMKGEPDDAAFIEELGFGDDFLFHPADLNIIGEDLMLSSSLTLTDLETTSIVEPPAGVEEKERFLELEDIFETGDLSLEMEDVELALTDHSPGTSQSLASQTSTPGTSQMENVKLTKTTQSNEPAKGRGRRRSKAKDEVAEVLRIRPPRKLKHRVSQHVPEEKKTAEYYEHRRKNTEAARKCREKKRGVDEKRVEIIKRQDERIKELEAKVASLKHDNKIYQDVIAKFAQSGENPPLPQRLQLPQAQAPRRLPKNTRKSRRRDRK